MLQTDKPGPGRDIGGTGGGRDRDSWSQGGPSLEPASMWEGDSLLGIGIVRIELTICVTREEEYLVPGRCRMWLWPFKVKAIQGVFSEGLEGQDG